MNQVTCHYLTSQFQPDTKLVFNSWGFSRIFWGINQSGSVGSHPHLLQSWYLSALRARNWLSLRETIYNIISQLDVRALCRMYTPNKPATCAPSVVSGVASTKPPVRTQRSNEYYRTITVLWTMSSVEVSTQYCKWEDVPPDVSPGLFSRKLQFKLPFFSRPFYRLSYSLLFVVHRNGVGRRRWFQKQACKQAAREQQRTCDITSHSRETRHYHDATTSVHSKRCFCRSLISWISRVAPLKVQSWCVSVCTSVCDNGRMWQLSQKNVEESAEFARCYTNANLEAFYKNEPGSIGEEAPRRIADC